MLKTHAVGIDLGTTYSAIAQLDESDNPRSLDNADGKNITPSVVLLGDDGHVMANCTRKTVCGIDGCTLSHRRELHTKSSGNDAGGSNKQQK